MTLARITRLARRLGPPGLLLLLAACAKDAPQDALAPEGPIAEQLDSLFRPVFWIATVIFVLVEALIVYAAIKFRDRAGREEPKQIHGNTRLELTWTVIPALLLAGISIPMVITLFDVRATPDPDEVRVRVIAKQWWWEYEYLNQGEPHVVTANELVIPEDRQIFLELESQDVIHSFWVPKLAGKQDVVPGRINTLKLVADEPGEWEGQCAEFCALSHANMRLRVIAKTQTEFDAWIGEQRRDALDPTSANAEAGQAIFFNEEGVLENEVACINCHAIRGTTASARVGPDLTHFASRGTFAGSSLPHEDFGTFEENLVEWIKNTRKLKPGVLMPVFEDLLDETQIRLLTAYLLSLR